MIAEFLSGMRILLEIAFVLIFVPTGLAVVYFIKALPEIKEVLSEKEDQHD